MYQLYTKWGDLDAYYHSATIFGLILAIVFNTVCALLYYYYGLSIFMFELFPIGVISAGIIVLTIIYFHQRKDHIEELNDNSLQVYNNYKYLIPVILIISTILFLIFTQFVYKWGFEKWNIY